MSRLQEPLLTHDPSKYCQLPIKYELLQKAYEIHESMFWSSKEIDYGADINDFNKLSNNEKHFVEHILAFFASADGIVLENLISNFSTEIQSSEARNFYAFQSMIENVHGMTYALLIDTFIKDEIKKEKLFNSIETIPCVQKKAEWALKWMSTSNHFEERIIAFIIVEGIFFSSSFASIFWLKNQNKMTKALGKSNELISRDEGLHTDFGVLIYKHLLNKVSQERVEQIFKEAVDIEIEFATESIPVSLIGMNVVLMTEYVKYCADRLLVQLDFKKMYNASNPFDFMKNLSLQGKTNFFEARVTEYQHSSVAKVNNDSWTFDF